MKKNTIYILAILAVATIGIFTACKKSLRSDEKEDPVHFYAEKFMTDESFVTFFKTTVTNSFKINKLAGNDKKGQTGNQINPTDTAASYDYVAEIVTAEVLFKAENPGFFELPIGQQIEVMNMVCNNLAVESYRLAHATAPLVIYATETLQYLNENGPLMKGTYAIDITWSEFGACTAAALGAVLGEYGGIVGEVWRMLSQGAQYLSWGGVFQIASRIVRNAVPWWKVASVAIGYATCLWAAA